jgi:hypothetical protein
MSDGLGKWTYRSCHVKPITMTTSEPDISPAAIAHDIHQVVESTTIGDTLPALTDDQRRDVGKRLRST